MDALNAHLLAQRSAGRLSVVVIDEAQAISIDVLERLRLLSNLETSTEKLLRLVLVGQPQLANVLLDPALAQLNQRITLRWHLGPLTYAETVAYVGHRLAVASGGQTKRIFTSAALALVHRYSKGVPRLVNMIAHRALLAAYVRRRRRVTARAVQRAYREIRTVPLRTPSPARRAGWLVTTAAAGVALVTLGVPRLGIRLDQPVPDVVKPATASEPHAAAAPAELPPSPARSVATVVSEPAVGLDERLARLDVQHGARSAVDAILALWHVAPLRPDEKLAPEGLEPVVRERGLEDLRLTGNLSMLRLLDLPVLLELRLPRVNEPRWVALTGIVDQQIFLSIGGETVTIDTASLDRVWFGEAHVLWRDFEALGRTFGTEARGAQVARLQELLGRVGVYRGTQTGVFDAATEEAVLGFQRSRLLVPDARVGRLTRIVLYAAGNGYQRPTLASAGAAS
jgi:general secretion pathway protein A